MKAPVKKSGRITHGNKQVKSILTEAAWAASRTKGYFYSARYRKLAARRGKKKAIIAVGHSILKSVYFVLENRLEYKELGAEYIDKRVEKARKAYLSKELERLGYNVFLITKTESPKFT